MDIRILRKMIHDHFPEKCLVDIVDYQNDDEQSYKKLFEELLGMYNSLLRERERSQHGLKEKSQQIEELKKEINSTNQTKHFLSDISNAVGILMQENITISNIRPVDKNGVEIQTASDKQKEYYCENLADRPGIYEFQRPSLFTEIEVEFNKINSAKKAVKEAEKSMKHRLFFWQNQKKKLMEQNISLETLMNEVDQERKERITALLNDSKMSNEEKYLKYMLLSPGMDKKYLKTLMGAADIGISANILIELLEQPKESFCKDTIEAYVSEVRKGNGYNLKRELAEELLKGNWCVMSDINGAPCKYQLLPVDEINRIKNELQKLVNTLNSVNGSEVGHQPMESANNEDVSTLSEYEVAHMELADEFLSEQVEFDDSMLDL